MRISDWSSDVCSSDLIGDELADGLFGLDPTAPQPLALFDALRTDFSLARLRHYTGTAPEHFQRYILFTNYHRYVDEFVRSEEHTSELQSLMRISYAVFCLKKKKKNITTQNTNTQKKNKYNT